MQEVKHELLLKRKFMKQSGANIHTRPTGYVLWADIDDILEYFIKDEDR